jgi:hypothetical protein
VTRTNTTMKEFTGYRLRNSPFPVKALAFGFICALGMAYVYALGNIALVIGLNPRDIAIHYYGQASERAHKDAGSVTAPAGEQKFSLGDALESKAAAPPASPPPSFKNLVAEGHFHLFGMTTFFFGLTLLGLLTAIPGNWKTLAVGTPYFFVILDNLSFMATRFLGPKFAWFTAASGGLMAVSFTILWVAIAYELIQSPATHVSSNEGEKR